MRGALAVGGLLLAILLTSCADTTKQRDFSFSDIPLLAKKEACENPETLAGDPNYWGKAAGLYCLPDTGTGVVVRAYDDGDATAKVIADWSDLIDSDNQLVYGNDWFATGPAAVLEDLFRDYEKIGPTTRVPVSTQPTDVEANLMLCSSVVYGVVSTAIIQQASVGLEEYFESYPGLELLEAELATQAEEDGAGRYSGDDLLLTAFLTRNDRPIKEFCVKAVAHG